MKITMLFLLYINQNTALKHLIQHRLTLCAVLSDVTDLCDLNGTKPTLGDMRESPLK